MPQMPIGDRVLQSRWREDMGAWRDWTPTVTQSAALAGVTVVEAKYCLIGKACHIYARLTIADATGAVGNNAIIVGGIPTAAQPALAAENVTEGICQLQDTGTAIYVASVVPYAAGGVKFLRSYAGAASNYLGIEPNFALANGDLISFTATYRVA